MAKKTFASSASSKSAVPARTKVGRTPVDDAAWTFLTNHFHVLILLARDPDLSLREVSLTVGITERSVQRIVADLEAGGYLQKERVGRSNHYRMVKRQRLRHPIEQHVALDEILHVINGAAETRGR